MTVMMLFFLFKQKTAYEMLSGDWSSDVCSSDLVRREVHLSNEPLPQETGGYLGIQHFDRHPAMRMLLHRQEHPGHATGADLALDVVAGSETLAQGVEHVEHLPKLVVGGRPSEWRVCLLADFRRRATIAG